MVVAAAVVATVATVDVVVVSVVVGSVVTVVTVVTGVSESSNTWREICTTRTRQVILYDFIMFYLFFASFKADECPTLPSYRCGCGSFTIAFRLQIITSQIFQPFT